MRHNRLVIWTDASNQAQTPQTASTAQLATSEPASVESVQASQPANMLLSHRLPLFKQLNRLRPLINWLGASNLQTQETSANVLTNASEDQGQGRGYSTDGYVPRCLIHTLGQKMRLLKMVLQSKSQRTWNLRWKRLTKLMLSFLKGMRQLLSMSTEPANALNSRLYNT